MGCTFSVIIPAHNASSHLGKCLHALRESLETPLEILVVDDGSSDDTRAVAESFGARVLSTGRRMGPAFARNLAASKAAGNVLFFLDADVCVKADTLSRIVDSLNADPELDALIGSYDNQPGALDFISQYRNLMHAYVHQSGAEHASTFWSGCGAIRRSVFMEHSGFSVDYKRPAIEDIELGYRLCRAGRRIILDRNILVTHLKRWTFWGLVKTDMLDRGIPWTELILRDRRMPNDLNLLLSQRISVALVFVLVGLAATLAVLDGAFLIAPMLAIVFLMLARWWGEFGSHQRPRRALAVLTALIASIVLVAYANHMRGLIPPLVAAPVLLWLRHRYSRAGKLKKSHRIVGLIFIGGSVCVELLYLPAHPLILAIFAVVALLGLMNSQFYIFLAGKRGIAFMLAAIPFHILYHFYNGLSFLAGVSLYYTRGHSAARYSSQASPHDSGAQTELSPSVVPDHSSRTIPPRRRLFLGLDPKGLIVLTFYIAMVVFAVTFYQQSEDEGRAWILCQSFPLRELIFHILRYEGHPGLYYLLLWGLCHTGLPFTTVNWLFALIASTGVYVLLRFSPFPFYLRALIPFGFAFGYQYAVEARSYALFPILGFLVVHLYRKAPVRPVAMAVVLAVLANVSLHGTMVAIGFAIAYGIQFCKRTRESVTGPGLLRQSWFGVGIFAISILLVLFCVWPVKYMNLSFPALGRSVAHRLLGPTSHNINPTPDKGSVSAPLRLAKFSATSLARPSVTSSASRTPVLSRLRFVLTYPVATSSVLAFLYEALVILFLLLRRRLVLLLPLVLLAYFLAAIYVQVWHCGLIWVTLILILWAAWDENVNPTDRKLQNAVAGLLAALCLLQLPWTVGALRYEKNHATFPARAAARYLKTLPPSERIDGNELAFTVMAFFPRYIFLDHGPARFAGHDNSPADISILGFLSESPDVILLRSISVTIEERAALASGGYTERHFFCGAPYFPNQPIVPICLSMFEKQ